ncbi:guanylate-binding protein 1-like [Pygocentrus nattereri]|uniref:GB1/RHD3-type G domain-containing protein n=1 Tax=Pygocentrus nattereri TaxID=42514 RepID=A0A3B4DS81_PYGNA|nr:guanylate-binding protein 1-like [Pygocentrus nattereri]
MSCSKSKIDMPHPVCLITNTEDGGLLICQEGIDILDQIIQPVVVVAVVGPYRTGKSYLMNRLAGKRKGFALGSTIESKTKGIWMWCVPHPHIEDHTLVLLDTEGLGDVDKGDEKHDVWIFCLAVLLSTTLVYNSLGTIDNTALEKLQYVTKLTEHIEVKSRTEDGESMELMRVFPSFVWTVRDFTLDLELDGKEITADEYLENALMLKKGDTVTPNVVNYNKTRRSLLDLFAVRKCFVFDRPGNAKTMKQIEKLADDDLDESFVEQSMAFCTYIYTNSKSKTMRGGRSVTGRMLATLAQTYVKAISSGQVPSLDNAVESLAQIHNSRAVQEAVEFYRCEMTKRVHFPTETQQELSDIHAGVEKEAISIFIKGSFNDQNQEYQKDLVKCLSKEYEELVKQNMEESRKVCRSIITRVFGSLEEEVKKGIYMRSGGYIEYCSALERAVQQYRSEKGHGLMVEQVLTNYLAENNNVGENILAADRSLSEAEREIEEERREKEALEQKNRQLEEQKAIQEKLFLDEKNSLRENIRQLTVKKEEEERRSREEIMRLQQAIHQGRRSPWNSFTSFLVNDVIHPATSWISKIF